MRPISSAIPPALSAPLTFGAKTPRQTSKADSTSSSKTYASEQTKKVNQLFQAIQTAQEKAKEFSQSDDPIQLKHSQLDATRRSEFELIQLTKTATAGLRTRKLLPQNSPLRPVYTDLTEKMRARANGYSEELASLPSERGNVQLTILRQKLASRRDSILEALGELPKQKQPEHSDFNWYA
jgi:ribosomal protein L17